MTAIHNRKPADTSALARPLRLQETIAELILEAMTFCVESKVEETVRKWLTHADVAPDDPHAEERATEAMIFALELSIFTPSMSGVRPIDRMARQFKAKTFDDAAALEALKKARFGHGRKVSVPGAIASGIPPRTGFIKRNLRARRNIETLVEPADARGDDCKINRLYA